MSKRRVLAISSDLDQLRRIVSTLERAGAEVDAARSVGAIAGDQIPHRYVFYSATDGDVTALNTLVPKLRDRAHVTIVTPKASLSDLTVYLRDDRVNHIVVGDELDHGVFVTAQKLLTGDIFGIEKYLPQGTTVHYARLRDFDGRGRAIDTVLEFAEQAKMRRQVRSAIGQVCEELLMNALYDAGHDKSFWCHWGVWPIAGICRVVTAEGNRSRRDRIGVAIDRYNETLAAEVRAYGANANGQNPRGVGFISDWVGSVSAGHTNTSVGTYAFTANDINGVDCFHPNVKGQSRLSCLAWAKSPDGAGPSASCFAQ